jgi:basic membrane protein A and related proteins
LRQVSKLAAVTIAGALALTATACGGSSSSSGSDSKKPKGAGLAFDVGGRGDNSFNDASYFGYMKARKEFHLGGKELVPREGESNDDKVQRLVQLARDGYNPVIGVGFVYSDAVNKVAKQYPRTNFAIIDDAQAKGPNIANLVFAEQQGSYLVGVAAALKTKSDNIGFIGGVKTPLIEKFQAGFVQGVHDTNPKAKIQIKYLSSPPDFKGFSDAPGGRDAANGMMDDGADVIYSAAGASGNGAIQAISQRHKWAIGVDSDQYKIASLAPYKSVILTSMVKDAGVAVYDFIKSVHDGKPESGVQTHDVTDNGIRYSTSNPVFANDKAIIDKLQAAKQKIVSGEIKVKTTP